MNKETVDKINQSDVKLSMVVTGGGSNFIGDFLSFGGGSATILDFQVPYSVQAQEDYICKKIDYKIVSERGAYELAKAAYDKQEGRYNNLLGVGVTASLIKTSNERTDRVNEFYVGIANKKYVEVYHFIIDKTQLYFRNLQEKWVSEIVLTLIQDNKNIVPNNYSKFIREVGLDIDNGYLYNVNKPTAFFSGSFNPIHEGHIGIHDYVKNELGIDQFIFERSTERFDKHSLKRNATLSEVTRGELWNYEYDLLITNQALILDKIEIYKDMGFENINIIMGVDTWNRFIGQLMDDSEYNVYTTNLNKVKFIVFNRDNFENWNDHGLNVTFIKDYDISMSSTQIRKKRS
jgi:nicotinic acid mononucleotide adenylyltransferase